MDEPPPTPALLLPAPPPPPPQAVSSRATPRLTISLLLLFTLMSGTKRCCQNRPVVCERTVRRDLSGTCDVPLSRQSGTGSATDQHRPKSKCCSAVNVNIGPIRQT